ncbi:DUF4911 domain-containing protein [Desulfolithobacter sp.]
MTEESILKLYLRIRPTRIGFFKFILEGYDNLATLSTLDRTRGLVRLMVPSSRYGELLDVISALAPKLRNNSDKRHED